MLSENGKIPGTRPIVAGKAEIGASEETGYAQAVSVTPPVGANLIKGGLRMAFGGSAVGVLQTLVVALKANYAVRMYRKVGFEIIDENEEEYIMVCHLLDFKNMNMIL